MSGSEPLWRRVAGLYLSGIPADAGERLSTRAAADRAGVPGDIADPTQEIIDLGEALDLVTLAQGYQSPAVPLLLRALIRAVRQTAAARLAAESAAETVMAGKPEATAEPESAERAAPAGDGASEAVPEPETPPAETTSAAETVPDVTAPAAATDALEKRVKETDQKLAALTTAVGQLVDVLQRRSRNGGGIDRRNAPRFDGRNAKIFVHGKPYEVVNWSKGGFLIRISETDRFSRGGFDFHFMLDLPDETIEFQGRARPVRIERTQLAAEFATLDAAAAAKIGAVADRLAAVG
jgi:hypothetical protein